MTVRPAKTQISLGISPVWSESLLSTGRKLDSLATHSAHSEDSDKTGGCPGWSESSLSAVILLVLSCHSPYQYKYLFSPGVLNFFLSNCCLLATNKTEGEGSRQRGSSVANSNLLSSWWISSWDQTWPSFVMLLISHIRDCKKRYYSLLRWAETGIRGIEVFTKTFEPVHVKTNEMTCAHSKDSDQPGHPPSVIRVSAVRMKKHWVLGYP